MRLIGFTEALKLVTSAKPINSKKAFKLGLVDFVYSKAHEERKFS